MEEELLNNLSKYVYKPQDPMWQDGLLIISHRIGNLEVKLIQFEFPSIEEKQMMRPVEKEYSIESNEEISSIYNQLQNIHSDVEWDTLVLEVKNNGSCIPHYELEGEEVFFSQEDSNSTSYILKNLHNCIAYNASNDYTLVAIEIKKKDNVSSARCLEAVPGSDDLKVIEPGEHIYAQNLAMKIFDENRLGVTNHWKKAWIIFYSSGAVKYKIE
jgi:hypothetical protein